MGMSFLHKLVCRTPRLAKVLPSVDVKISIRSWTSPFRAFQNGYPNRCARKATIGFAAPRSTWRSTSVPALQHCPHKYELDPDTGAPTMPSVRTVVFPSGAEFWKPEGALEYVYGLPSARLGPDDCTVWR